MQKLEFIFSNTCTIDRLHGGLKSKNGIAPLVPLIIRGVIDRLNLPIRNFTDCNWQFVKTSGQLKMTGVYSSAI